MKRPTRDAFLASCHAMGISSTQASDLWQEVCAATLLARAGAIPKERATLAVDLAVSKALNTRKRLPC